LPATIISRCQRFDLQPIRDDVAAAHLLTIAREEKVSLDPVAAEVIARAAEGGMRDAESMLDQVVSFCGDNVTEKDVLAIFGFASATEVAALAGHMLQGDAASALSLVSAQSEEGKDLGRFLADLVSLCRDLLVTEVTGQEMAGRRGELIAPLRGKFSARKLTELLEVLSAAEAGLRFSPDKKLPLEIAVIKSIQLLHTADLDEVLSALATMRGGGEAPAAPARPLPRAAAPRPAVPSVKPASPIAPIQAAAQPKPASAGESVSSLWLRVVEHISQKQPLRSAWLEKAGEVEEDAGTLRVVFPADQQKQIKTPHAIEQAKTIEELWHQWTGRKISFQPEASGEIQEPKKMSGAAIPVADDFENDPGIEAAIELFGATLESAGDKKS
jgi:DNA polymerase-3 subunit gamma/tau